MTLKLAVWAEHFVTNLLGGIIPILEMRKLRFRNHW